jgi:RNA polymerase sigma-70 factor (ECF subfamily)
MRCDRANSAPARSPIEPQSGPNLTICQAEGGAADCCISEEEFVALTVRYERRVRLFVATLHPKQSDIDEIVQDAWLVAWKKINTFRYTGEQPDEEFVRWVCTISRFEVIKYRKKSAPRLFLSELVMDQLAALQLEKAEYFDVRHDALTRCVEKLRPRDKQLIQRRYEQGVSVHDVANEIGRSVDAVYKSLNRIRASLLACIERTLKREGYF